MEELADHRRRGCGHLLELTFIEASAATQALEMPLSHGVSLGAQQGERVDRPAPLQPPNARVDLAVQVRPQAPGNRGVED